MGIGIQPEDYLMLLDNLPRIIQNPKEIALQDVHVRFTWDNMSDSVPGGGQGETSRRQRVGDLEHEVRPRPCPKNAIQKKKSKLR